MLVCSSKNAILFLSILDGVALLWDGEIHFFFFFFRDQKRSLLIKQNRNNFLLSAKTFILFPSFSETKDTIL